MKYENENVKRLVYAGGATFVPVCSLCGRFVKADEYIYAHELHGLSKRPNATCKKCGRVEMLFEGFNDISTISI